MGNIHHTVKVPITDGYTPNVYVQVDLVGAALRTDDTGQPDPKLPRRPAYASGHFNLGVLLLQHGQVEEAIQHLRETLRLQPNFPRARERLQQALARAAAS